MLLLLLAEGWVPSETSLKRESFNDIVAAFAVSCRVTRLRYLLACTAYIVMDICIHTHTDQSGCAGRCFHAHAQSLASSYCTYFYDCVWACAYIHAYMHTYTHTHTHTCTHTYTHAHIHIHALHISTHTHIYIYIYIDVCIHT